MNALWLIPTIAVGALLLLAAGLSIAALIYRKRADWRVGRVVSETRREIRNGRS